MILACKTGVIFLRIKNTPVTFCRLSWHWIPYNNSFIDQVCSVKMSGYWPRAFFASYFTGQYPAILTSHLVNNPSILHFSWNVVILARKTGVIVLPIKKNHACYVPHAIVTLNTWQSNLSNDGIWWRQTVKSSSEKKIAPNHFQA